MKKHLLTLVCTTILSISTFAQSGSGRVSLGTGLLYENGWDVTLAYEHETKYHNAWEFFGNVYLNGMNVLLASTSALTVFGRTIARMA